MIEFDCLALDAMGVIYQSGDDVTDLLIPFVTANGGSGDHDLIERTYVSASLGEIRAERFWREVGLDPALEDEYLRRHRLADGVGDLLRDARRHGLEVCCISNDVSEWSRKLRRRFQLESDIGSWFVSGDVGVRKPDRAIYDIALAESRCEANRMLFVDDRIKNLDAARAVGIATAHLSATPVAGGDHRQFASIADVSALFWKSRPDLMPEHRQSEA